MVINRTRAVDVSIQAVSPVLSDSVADIAPDGGAGGAAAAASGAGCAHAAAVESATAAPISAPVAWPFKVISLRNILFSPVAIEMVLSSERVGIGFTCTDAHDMLERRDEDLAVADLAGLGFARDRADDGV